MSPHTGAPNAVGVGKTRQLSTNDSLISRFWLTHRVARSVCGSRAFCAIWPQRYAIRSHDVSCHPAGETFPSLSQESGTDLATREGCRAELTSLAGYIPKWYTCSRPKTLTHSTTNRIPPHPAYVATLPCEVFDFINCHV